MTVTRIRKDEKKAMAMYMELSGALITLDKGTWYISTPQETMVYDTTADMMEDINMNLSEMKKVLTEEEWEEAEETVERRAISYITWR